MTVQYVDPTPLSMRFRVRLLRRRGQRLPWREVLNSPSYVLDLVTVSVDISGERYQAAELRAADPMVPSPIPKLYEPALLGFAPQAFRLRGFERVESSQGSYAVVQEWHCEEA
jgi:hypothetical protein